MSRAYQKIILCTLAFIQMAQPSYASEKSWKDNNYYTMPLIATGSLLVGFFIKSFLVQKEINGLRNHNKNLIQLSKDSPFTGNNKNLISDNEKLIKSNEKLISDNGTLQGAIQKTEQNNSLLEGKVELLTTENKSLKEANGQFELKIKNYDENNQTLTSENKKLKTDNDTLKQENEKLKVTDNYIKSIKLENGEQKKIIGIQSDNIISKQSTIDNLVREKNQLQKKIENGKVFAKLLFENKKINEIVANEFSSIFSKDNYEITFDLTDGVQITEEKN